MGDFDDFTRQMRGNHEAASKQHEEQVARAAAERDADWDGQIALLEEVAGPIILEAANACERQGMRPVIERNWDKGRYMAPAIAFRLFGPKQRPHDASTYEIEASSAHIKVEDGKLRANLSNRSFKSKVGTDYVGYGAEGISQALKLCIASYFEEIAPGS
ncbi:hypothetical protein GR702_12575 [Novosphingobium sp. FGD1]|jgi:hypothetical protein|uniref:Uncharacterized protein n=1 Tax=Novosphingobium silvae TaxID=2692619 RepID=A0A7X4GHU7_9SPHN|nr:hypothetical protein [Novosphingobium silvae]MYL98600.1 hypothetical protein [Novosphingobium silvae]